jgi:hypothetical protein
VTRFLALISVILLTAIPSYAATPITDGGIIEADTAVTYEYNLLMNVRGREVTGLCVMSVSPDNNVLGTVINEFGVKLLDFTHEAGKTKVLNVIKMLDKWYIRKVLRKDLNFFLLNRASTKGVNEKKRSLEISNDGDIIIRNQRFRITYTFSPQRGTDK